MRCLISPPPRSASMSPRTARLTASHSRASVILSRRAKRMNSFVLKTFTSSSPSSEYIRPCGTVQGRRLPILGAGLSRLASAPWAVVGDAEIGFEDAAVALERGAGGLIDDGA